jgi:hypothetical protein
VSTKSRKGLVIAGPFPISELPSREKPVTKHLEDLRGIPRGMVVEIGLSYGGARDMIRRLEETGQIVRGQYKVHLHTGADGKHVFIMHNPGASPSKRRHAYRKVDLQKVSAYIEGKKNFEHTLGEIQDYLFGRVGSPRTDPEIYYPALHATLRARKIIEDRRGGKFVSERRDDGTKLYRFEEARR